MKDPVARALLVAVLHGQARIERKLDSMTQNVDDQLTELETAVMGNLEPAVAQELAALSTLKSQRGGVLSADQEARFQALVTHINAATAGLLQGVGADPAAVPVASNPQTASPAGVGDQGTGPTLNQTDPTGAPIVASDPAADAPAADETADAPAEDAPADEATEDDETATPAQ